MARLVTVRGIGDSPQQFPLDRDEIVLGRMSSVDLRLESREVSRLHARISRVNNRFFLEDLGSSNGTFVNGMRVQQRIELREQDQIRIGPFVLRFEESEAGESQPLIRAEVTVHSSNVDLFRLDAERKLKAVLEISHQLSGSLDLDAILPRLLDALMRLFMQADRGLILLWENGQLMARASVSRDEARDGPAYSRSVVRRVLEEGVGLVAEDVAGDSRFDMMQSVNRLNVRSFLCVPLKTSEGRPLGVVQLDTFRLGQPFTKDDLHLATALALHAGAVIENARLHAELLRQERVQHELMLARKIQDGFLPSDFDQVPAGLELYARVCPATEVSGDFYDFQQLSPTRLAVTVADVVGKGIPAALYMTATRTLCRHLATTAPSPAVLFDQLNAVLYEDNQTMMFATVLHGVIDAPSGEVVLASAGHPTPLLRRRNGVVEHVVARPGRPIGAFPMPVQSENVRIRLEPGDTLLLFTDGAIEAPHPVTQERFGIERLAQYFGSLPAHQTLEQWCDRIRREVADHTRGSGQGDDITLLLLRRVAV
ncbi:MAG: SpoIIE family protein phosphatase [Gemmatales bacterium]|nr:SpoIIE family protein phosphatase [Gemmatales bacterium]MDW8386723.1 SpoIIE family protein phosphatase [Gemmatales bacterium]